MKNSWERRDNRKYNIMRILKNICAITFIVFLINIAPIIMQNDTARVSLCLIGFAIILLPFFIGIKNTQTNGDR